MACTRSAMEISAPDGRPYLQEALVHPDLCVRCGICVGSCDTVALSLPGYNLISLRSIPSPLHCRELSAEELERFPEPMRPPLVGTRGRWPVLLWFE